MDATLVRTVLSACLGDVNNSLVSCHSTNFDAVMAKVQEILRKMEIKFPVEGGGLGAAGDQSRVQIAVEIACRLLQVSFDKKKLLNTIKGANSSAQSQSTFSKLLTTVTSALRIEFPRPAASVAQLLSVRFGEHIKIACLQLLEQARLANCGDVANDAMLAAAYFITLKQRKIPVDQNMILQATSGSVEAHAFRTSMKSLRLVAQSSAKRVGEMSARDIENIRISLKHQQPRESDKLPSSMSLSAFLQSGRLSVGTGGFEKVEMVLHNSLKASDRLRGADCEVIPPVIVEASMKPEFQAGVLYRKRRRIGSDKNLSAVSTSDTLKITNETVFSSSSTTSSADSGRVSIANVGDDTHSEYPRVLESPPASIVSAFDNPVPGQRAPSSDEELQRLKYLALKEKFLQRKRGAEG